MSWQRKVLVTAGLAAATIGVRETSNKPLPMSQAEAYRQEMARKSMDRDGMGENARRAIPGNEIWQKLVCESEHYQALYEGQEGIHLRRGVMPKDHEVRCGHEHGR